ncbi:MAG TPA: HlyD family efflux transporter periplasmic adaptor subunit [Rhodopila sp.]|uniref:HlyD family secretion protein n=1 Tax=Rhodopila sp. TaxID=2480087 RepID=UPI002C24321B|nr:HlyD family efflux transporter periplasmic adaptor subunit [Rhodopila sp.]HVY15056.1 HlyD family efflux transporter periplasmic adaptor subunit [Rhodopila sp.]
MTRRSWLWIPAILVVAGIGYLAWSKLQPPGLPPGIASGNGRTEATEIDIAAKIAGRIKDITVDEGDFVTQGEVLAHMDTATLDAQKREAEAQLQRAIIAVSTAQALLNQRNAERTAALAVVDQRNADVDAADRRLARSQELAPRAAVPMQTLDDDRARSLAAKAAVAAAQAQAAASEAAIGAAQSQVIDAKAAVDAARASIERIQADIDDSTLTAPRDGRVQYRVAQPGEVLSAGGRVLNMIDLSDVYMTFYLPTAEAGLVAIGAEARIVLDAAPRYVIPASISFVSDVAQFTPKTVETEEERQKLMFRIKARIPPELLRKYIKQVKTGLPGVVYVKLRRDAQWPGTLTGTLVR